MTSIQIGTRIKEARLAKGLTQVRLAKLAGVSQTMIGNLEAGSRDGTTKIASLAEALGVRALWLETGKLPMKDGEPKQSLSSDGLKLLEMYAQLPPESQFEVLSFVAFKLTQSQLANSESFKLFNERNSTKAP